MKAKIKELEKKFAAHNLESTWTGTLELKTTDDVEPFVVNKIAPVDQKNDLDLSFEDKEEVKQSLSDEQV